MNATNQSLEAREKANEIKISDLVKECVALQLTKTENDRKLYRLLSDKQELDKRLVGIQQLLELEEETTAKLRDALKEKNATLDTKTAEVEQLQKSEQSLTKRFKKVEQDLSQVQRLTTTLEDEDQRNMLVLYFTTIC